MKMNAYLVPVLIGLAALGAIWYISRQSLGAVPVPPQASTSGNDTASPGVSGGATPGTTVSAGTQTTGASNPSAPFGIMDPTSW